MGFVFWWVFKNIKSIYSYLVWLCAIVDGFIPVQKTFALLLIKATWPLGAEESRERQRCVGPGARGAWSPRELQKYSEGTNGIRTHKVVPLGIRD